MSWPKISIYLLFSFYVNLWPFCCREHGKYLRRKNRKKRLDPNTFEKMQHEEFAEWFKDHVNSIMQFNHDLLIVGLNLAYILLFSYRSWSWRGRTVLAASMRILDG
jgi:hypothetical protein